MKTPKLRPYQLRGKAWIVARRFVLMLLPMGAGKTAICCDWIADWDIRVLVVAPLRVCLTVWPKELNFWAPGVTHRVVHGELRKRKRAMEQDAEVTIVNYDNLTWFLETQVLDYDAIIFDELTGMKNWKSKRFKAYIKRRKKFERFIGLTGTFTAKGVIDTYAQVRAIDGGKRLGKTLTAFRAAFMIKGFMDWDWKPKPFSLRQIMKRVANIAFTVTDEEYLSTLPPLVPNIIKVQLPKEARETYSELMKEYIATHGPDILFTPNAAALNNKLQQIANGWAYAGGVFDPKTGKKSPVTAVKIHDAKLDALDEIIDSQQGAPTMIVYRYKHELDAMMKRFPGTVMNEEDPEEVVDAWNRKAITNLYVHPRSAGHGLNLQYGGNVLVWLGLTWSYEEFSQVIKRLLRSGQTKPVFSHVIMAEDTVDQDAMDRVEQERLFDEEMMKGLQEEMSRQ